jgi:hypothetical protein
MPSADAYAIDWRRLLTSIGIQWRDKGPNTRRGNVNIRCPLCGNDPSFHMAISEDIEAFICYRDSRHAGRSFTFLLHKLGIGRYEAVTLLNSHIGRSRAIEPEKIVREQSRTDRLWDSFHLAHERHAFEDYLRYERGIDPARSAIERYDLRYAIEGKWARRLLLPFRDHDGKLITWAGRSIDGFRTPKYLMESQADQGAVYRPRLSRDIMILCEGPLDALKIASATENEDISPIATAGKNLNSAKLLRLRRMCEGRIVLFAPDQDVSIGERNKLHNSLAASLNARYIRCLPVPDDYKDPAEIPLDQITPWIKECLRARQNSSLRFEGAA